MVYPNSGCSAVQEDKIEQPHTPDAKKALLWPPFCGVFSRDILNFGGLPLA